MLDYDLAQHEVRLMVGDPKAEAYEWFRVYARYLEVDPEDLIRAATLNGLDFGPGEGTELKINSNIRSSRLWVDPELWNKLEILLETEIHQRFRRNFFC